MVTRIHISNKCKIHRSHSRIIDLQAPYSSVHKLALEWKQRKVKTYSNRAVKIISRNLTHSRVWNSSDSIEFKIQYKIWK